MHEVVAALDAVALERERELLLDRGRAPRVARLLRVEAPQHGLALAQALVLVLAGQEALRDPGGAESRDEARLDNGRPARRASK